MQSVQLNYSCIDCFRLLTQKEEKTYCEDCLSLVCSDCVDVTLDIYLCNSCMNERYARDENTFE
jgi:hypothetical protein